MGLLTPSKVDLKAEALFRDAKGHCQLLTEVLDRPVLCKAHEFEGCKRCTMVIALDAGRRLSQCAGQSGSTQDD